MIQITICSRYCEPILPPQFMWNTSNNIMFEIFPFFFIDKVFINFKIISQIHKISCFLINLWKRHRVITACIRTCSFYLFGGLYYQCLWHSSLVLLIHHLKWWCRLLIRYSRVKRWTFTIYIFNVNAIHMDRSTKMFRIFYIVRFHTTIRRTQNLSFFWA